MYIREATVSDNKELQLIQSKCPMGSNLVVSTKNSPDFFARAKAYKSFKVFVTCENNRIVGSMAVALRHGKINNTNHLIGYEFQAFTCPEFRRKGIATILHKHIESYLIKKSAVLSYAVIMEDNFPSLRTFDKLGFLRYSTLLMPSLLVYRKIDNEFEGIIREAKNKDLAHIAKLINETWKDYNFYEPITVNDLAEFIKNTPEFNLDNLIVLEDKGKILACIGFWDWSKITEITVKSFSFKMKMFFSFINIMSHFRQMPRTVKIGEKLKQMILIKIGFKEVNHLKSLINFINNMALEMRVGQIFLICETDHLILESIKEYEHIDTKICLYFKPLKNDIVLGNYPTFIDGVDF